MAWIESHQSLSAHPKTRKAARALDVPVPHLIGHLHCLWHWALDLAEDGDLSKFDADDIAIAAQWEGDPDEFVSALVNCGPGDSAGFLERDGEYGPPDDPDVGDLVLHDWWDYAGKLVARRIRDRRRKREERASNDSPQDVQRTSCGHPVEGPQDGRLVGSSVGSKESNESKKSNVAEIVDQQFEAFWKAYPRGQAGKPGGDGPKKPASKKWRRMTADQRQAALEAVKHYRAHVEAPEGPYAAHAITWLNQERWEQWQEPARASPDGLVVREDGTRGHKLEPPKVNEDGSW